MGMNDSLLLKDNMNLAPIVLFTYTRKNHLILTIDSLKHNQLAKLSDIYIYSDAPKVGKELEVEAVREYIKTIKGFKNIYIIERTENYGLARNIVEAVTEIVQQYGKVIVLEDDIVTSPFFLDYMNCALLKYQMVDQVMAISGYIPPINDKGLSETFFLPWFYCWGWGTWDQAWNKMDTDVQNIVKRISKVQIDYINCYGTNKDPWRQVLANKNGTMKTWAIFFYVAICNVKGLVLFPKDCYSKSIGLDGTGEHSQDCYEEDFRKLNDNQYVKLPPAPIIDEVAVKRVKEYYKSITGIREYYRKCLRIWKIGGCKLVLMKIQTVLKRVLIKWMKKNWK